MRYKWSGFVVRYSTKKSFFILKNFFTGAVIKLTSDMLSRIDYWLDGKSVEISQDILSILTGENEFLVSADKNEFSQFREDFLEVRNNKAELFTLYFLPTIKCQLDCSCCFEKGIVRIGRMSEVVLDQSVSWIADYLKVNKEVKYFKFVLFGGEPLLEKDLVRDALAKFSHIVNIAGVEFWTEIITNGEFLDEDTAFLLKQYGWRRVQITLDGPKSIHDLRRCHKNGKGTFDSIISNVKTVLSRNLIEKVNLRLSIDEETADLLPDLVKYIAGIGFTDRIQLSLGIIVPSIDTQMKEISEEFIAKKVIEVWCVAKSFGFETPEEFVVGPWCVAIAKHSAVLQPNGSIQKCFCTVGRNSFDFTTVFKNTTSYAQDPRFEIFNRVDECVSERCPYLPVCGGGCIHDSIVKYGLPGFSKRLCQKNLISQINEGLVHLGYEGY